MRPFRKNVTKRWIIIVLLVLFVYIGCLAAYFQWGMYNVYLSLVEKPTSEHRQIALQIESVGEELAKMPNLVNEREQELAEAEELLANEQNSIPGELNINNLIRTIAELAERCQVKVIPLKTTPSESQIINAYSYGNWHISMHVEGKLQHIASFLDNIDGKLIPTATIASIVLQRSDQNPGGLSVENNNTPVNGMLELVIYTR